MQLIMDTLPKQGGGGGGQTREEVVDALCEELLGKVGSWMCGGLWWAGSAVTCKLASKARQEHEGGC